MIYEGKHRINYYDLNSAGRIKLSALLRMVHIAADVNANDLGIGFKRLFEKGMSFVLNRFAVGIIRMPAYDEIVTLRTWADSTARGAFWRKGDMHDANGAKIMEWASMWILFDISERKILKPGVLSTEIASHGDFGVKIVPEKIVLPQAEAQTARIVHTVRYADVDTNMHMNNSIYGDVIENAVYSVVATPECEKSSVPHLPPLDRMPDRREVQINYLAETRLGETIEITTHRENNTITVAGKASQKVSFAAQVKLL
ncbi:MAG: thioesterase [Defluviitaleaceae bacterium]|nr:thioesterase [Defluviitaleaceae bacterium]